MLLLFLFAVGLAPDLGFVREHYWILFSILAYGALVVGVTAVFILGLSSTSRSGRIVGVAFIAVAMFSGMMGTFLHLVTRSNQVLALSLGHNLTRISDLLFMQESSVRMSPVVSLAMAALVVAWSIWTLNRRIRPVEVVA